MEEGVSGAARLAGVNGAEQRLGRSRLEPPPALYFQTSQLHDAGALPEDGNV
jgi:hypothetical protein